MKKLMMLLLALMLCASALADTSAIPAERVEPAAGQMTLEDAIVKGRQAMPVNPEQAQTRAESVKMSDGGYRYVVTMFDLTTLVDGWCVELDASGGAVLASYTTYDGFFQDAYDRWVARKGIHALWSLEDKQLFDALYALQPSYGLPLESDMSAGNALTKALFVLGLESSEGYAVGYGYLMGGEGYNGVWEICLVVDGEVDAQVNLDAVTGEVYYLDVQMVEADEANG